MTTLTMRLVKGDLIAPGGNANRQPAVRRAVSAKISHQRPALSQAPEKVEVVVANPLRARSASSPLNEVWRIGCIAPGHRKSPATPIRGLPVRRQTPSRPLGPLAWLAEWKFRSDTVCLARRVVAIRSSISNSRPLRLRSQGQRREVTSVPLAARA